MHTTKVPGYLHHKASGQAFTRLNGQNLYLGPYGSKASKREYDRVIAEWLANGKTLPGTADPDGPAVAEVIAAFLKHADKYYRDADGNLTSEPDTFRMALKPLRELYGPTPAKDFSPLALQAVRQRYIELGWCRKVINRQVGRVRSIFKWAVAREMAPPATWQALQAVDALKRGRCDAKESDPVRPVPPATVEAVLPYLPGPVEALVRLQLLSGARPGELLHLRPIDLDMTGKVWMTKGIHHKNSWRDQSRTLYFGPKAQEILRDFLNRPVDAYLFSPAEALQEMRDERRNNRVIPINRGNIPGSNRKDNPKRQPGGCYTNDSYCRSIRRACEQAFPPSADLARKPDETIQQWQNRLTDDQKKELHRWNRDHCWHPHQLRHTAATMTRKEFGPDAARALLGHRTIAATAIYAELDEATVCDIVRKIG